MLDTYRIDSNNYRWYLPQNNDSDGTTYTLNKEASDLIQTGVKYNKFSDWPQEGGDRSSCYAETKPTSFPCWAIPENKMNLSMPYRVKGDLGPAGTPVVLTIQTEVNTTTSFSGWEGSFEVTVEKMISGAVILGARHAIRDTYARLFVIALSGYLIPFSAAGYGLRLNWSLQHNTQPNDVYDSIAFSTNVSLVGISFSQLLDLVNPVGVEKLLPAVNEESEEQSDSELASSEFEVIT